MAAGLILYAAVTVCIRRLIRVVMLLVVIVFVVLMVLVLLLTLSALVMARHFSLSWTMALQLLPCCPRYVHQQVACPGVFVDVANRLFNETLVLHSQDMSQPVEPQL